MKTNINKVELAGFAGMDVEIKEVKRGVKFGRFSLATSEGYRNTNGEWVNNTTWHNIVLWNDMAEKAEGAVKKGAFVTLTGKINYRNYETKDGQKRNAVEIMASNIEIMQ